MSQENETLIFEDDAPQTAVLRLLEEMNRVAQSKCEEGEDSGARKTAETLDKIARSMSSTLKCLSDLHEQNARLRAADNDKKYTRYEDLPPPSPEERRRFLGRLDHLVSQVEPLSDAAAAAELETLRQ